MIDQPGPLPAAEFAAICARAAAAPRCDVRIAEANIAIRARNRRHAAAQKVLDAEAARDAAVLRADVAVEAAALGVMAI